MVSRRHQAFVGGGARQQETLSARLQQVFHAGHLAADSTAGNRLEVLAAAQNHRTQLLTGDHNASGLQNSQVNVGPPTATRLTCLQCLATARPSGCSLLASAVPTKARIFLRGIRAVSHNTRTRVTRGTPAVMVPVLSNITARI